MVGHAMQTHLSFHNILLFTKTLLHVYNKITKTHASQTCVDVFQKNTCVGSVYEIYHAISDIHKTMNQFQFKQVRKKYLFSRQMNKILRDTYISLQYVRILQIIIYLFLFRFLICILIYFIFFLCVQRKQIIVAQHIKRKR